jgi:DNA-binding NtrC family response regulator
LGAVIDRAAILGDGKTLEVVKSLGAGVPSLSPSVPTSQTTETASAPRNSGSAPFVPLNIAMRKHIERARGRIEGPHGAAALLKINPHTLRARMRKLGVDWGQFRSE